MTRLTLILIAAGLIAGAYLYGKHSVPQPVPDSVIDQGTITPDKPTPKRPKLSERDLGLLYLDYLRDRQDIGKTQQQAQAEYEAQQRTRECEIYELGCLVDRVDERASQWANQQIDGDW